MAGHDRDEVLRYLGRRGQSVPPELDALVADCMAELDGKSAPRKVCAMLPLRPEPGGLRVGGTALLLPGADIRRHVRGCNEAVLFAATLGVGVDNLIRRWSYTDLTRSVVLDACATEAIEAFCDEAEADLRRQLAERGQGLTSRFSPGYGDLPLDVQPLLLSVLDAPRRIGLTCTERHILLPRKSVTAVLGVGAAAETSARGCRSCARRDTCNFRKDDGDDGCACLPQG